MTIRRIERYPASVPHSLPFPTSSQVTLEPRSKPYSIMPTTFYPEKECAFTIRAYAREPFTLAPTPL